jgi:hypothetical protein
MEVSGQLHAPVALPPYHLDRRLGERQNLPGRREEEKNLLSLPVIESSVVQPVA